MLLIGEKTRKMGWFIRFAHPIFTAVNITVANEQRFYLSSKKTIMKKVLLLVSIFLLIAIQADAQSWLDKVGKKVENAAKRTIERKAEQKTEEAVNKAVDKATDKETYKGSSKEKNSETIEWTEKESGQIESDHAGQGNMRPEMTYAKSDFVPGDEIFFEDDLVKEQMGEFPSQWDLLEGAVDVASINGIKAIAFEPGGFITPLMKDMAGYLPDVFTLEFDFWINDKENTLDQEYKLFFSKDKTFYPSDVLIQLKFGSINSDRKGTMAWPYKTSSGNSRDGEGVFEIEEHSWHHLSVSFNKRAFKAYVNGIRIANIPNAAAPKTLAIYASDWGGITPGTIAITNIRMAKGAVPLYDRMMTEGKFISYGITFDVGKSTIKPESYSELNRIVTLMKENPDLKFSVEGHTDSTGSAASNQTLSEQRSQAVMDELAKMGIDKSRLSASGKGQTSPIADNATDEGRAKNRRVEFVKQ